MNASQEKPLHMKTYSAFSLFVALRSWLLTSLQAAEPQDIEWNTP